MVTCYGSDQDLYPCPQGYLPRALTIWAISSTHFKGYRDLMPSDYATVVGMEKMGNIEPKVAIESTSLAFQASVLTITSPGLPDVTSLPTPTCLCCSLPERYYTHLPGIVSLLMLAINCIYTDRLRHRQAERSLYRIMVTATSVMGGWRKWEILHPERESNLFQASVLTISPPRLFDVTTLPSPTCLCSSLTERLGQTTTLVPLEL